MDAIINPILERIRALELAVYGVPADDSGHAVPAQAIDPRRLPSAPGMPIAPFDPNVHYEEGTQDTIDAENAAKASPSPMLPMTVREGEPAITDPPLDEDGNPIDMNALDPTLNQDGTPRRRRKQSDD